MRLNQLGKTGLSVSELSLGTHVLWHRMSAR